jgi:hypothetical protein
LLARESTRGGKHALENRPYRSHTLFYSPLTIRGTPHRRLALHEPREHAFGIDCDEQALAAREHFPFFVEDLGHIDVLASFHFNLARFHPQGLLQRHRLQVIHGHLGSHRNHLTHLVHLAHRLIEDGRDDATMAVSGRAAIALAQPKLAGEAPAVFVIGEAKSHAIRIVGTAGEAIILLQLDVAGVVARVGASLFGSEKCGSNGFGFLAGHRKILSRAIVETVYHSPRTSVQIKDRQEV